MKLTDFDCGETSVSAADMPQDACFIFEIQDDQFEPIFHKGDALLFAEQDEIEIGAIGAYLKDKQLYIKQKGVGVLRSLNPRVEDMPITDDVFCLGKFHKKVKVYNMRK